MLSLKLVCRKVPDIKMLICRDIHKNYYDALGLTPKATQADIKKAYYKMSMVYHPDKGEGNTVKFQEISTAYEVLGNNKLRKLYDKGMLPSGASRYAEAQEQARTSRMSEAEWSGGQSSSSSSSSRQKNRTESQERSYSNFYDNVNAGQFEETARSKGPHTGRSQHYDFDAWTRAHYSETFAKQEYQKAERDRMKRKQLEKLQKLDNIITSMFVVLVAGAIWIGMTWPKHDHVTIYRPQRKDDN